MVAGLAPGTGARAQEVAAFTATARADSYLVRVDDGSLPLIAAQTGGRFDHALSTAQALLSSVGRSKAYASAPDAEFEAALPGTANGALAGTAPPLPDYPFAAVSDFPSEPEASVEAGAYVLRSASSESDSVATARTGLVTDGPSVVAVTASADVRHDRSTDEVLAAAAATTDAFTVAGVLEIGAIESTATMRSTPGSLPASTTSFAITGLAIGGVGVRFAEDGLEVAGTPIQGVDAGALDDVLEGAGISVRLVPAEQTPTSIRSAGLEITYTTEVPTHGPVALSLIVGQVSASIDASVAPPRPPVPAVAAVQAPPGASVPPAAPYVVEPVVPALPALSTPAPVVAPPAPASITRRVVPDEWATWAVYAALAATAGGGFVLTRLFGAFGIRLGRRRDVAALDGPSLRLPS